MKFLVIVILYLLKGGICGLNLTEYAGQSIIIKCNYTSAHVNEEKYFCKEGHNLSCDKQIRSNVSEKWWQSKGRFSLYDNTAKSFLKVSIRNLTESDSGKYRCGVGGREIKSTDAYLNVMEGKTESRIPPVYEGYTGKNISIMCPYDLGKYGNVMKYFCKNEAVACTDRIRTGIKDQWIEPQKDSRGKDRFYLYDNTTGGFFMVNITNLTTEDAGTYWCGVHVSFQNSPLSVDNLTEVILNVKNGSHKDDSNDISPGITAPLFMTLVVVAALVFGAAFFFCWQHRRNNSKGLATDSNLEEHNNQQDSGHRDCEYEEIQEPTHPLNRAGTEDNAVYANAQLPTNLSDNHTYSTDLPTMQSDNATCSTARLPTMHSVDATYSMAQLPKMQSDNATYSMAQLPKMQSDNATYSMAQLPKMQSDNATYSMAQLPKMQSTLHTQVFNFPTTLVVTPLLPYPETPQTASHIALFNYP
ncbi:CMRF35-like molecule 8 [Alosa sapidissima]|uniref:CMRF35-like molecule 8 n=1 Tax=Alosa sapidissima TaxID=34773 RepID=UPI001C0985BF|nr:CMRF35-like molecule 8 [Alosa sapidissima]